MVEHVRDRRLWYSFSFSPPWPSSPSSGSVAACGKCPRRRRQTDLPAQDATTPERQAAQARRPSPTFRKGREDRLRQPGSWLTLVGLYWLHDGDNSAGSAPTSEIIFPPSLPASLGTFVVPGQDGAAAELRTSGGFQVDVQEGKRRRKPARRWCRSSPTPPTRGPRSAPAACHFYLIDRQGKLGVRIKDSESETFKNFQGIETYPVILGMAQARCASSRPRPAKRSRCPTCSARSPKKTPPAPSSSSTAARPGSWKPCPTKADDGISFVFGDGTNGKAGGSYGGGRFLDAKVDGGEPQNRERPR